MSTHDWRRHPDFEISRLPPRVRKVRTCSKCGREQRYISKSLLTEAPKHHRWHPAAGNCEPGPPKIIEPLKTAFVIASEAHEGSRLYLSDPPELWSELERAKRFPDKYDAWKFVRHAFAPSPIPRNISVLKKRIDHF